MNPFSPFRLLIALIALASAQGADTPPLLLISMDGFRWDYAALHPADTPNLRALIAAGTAARALIPVYPTNTFPNHYSIVTGLYPSHHGIINNDFFDPGTSEYFRYNRAASVQKNIWWGGEPIWVTARQQGLKSASSFWVGSEAEIKGVRPDFWKPYDSLVPFEKRFEELFSWLALPAAQRPAVIAFYLEETNSVGHKRGPDSPELAAVVKRVDDHLGAIIARAGAEGIALNFVIVSDHGMTPISTERIVILDACIDPKSVQIDFDGPVAGLRPLAGDVASLLKALAPLRHAKAYGTEDLPARFHVTANPRNPAVWIVPDEGWEIYTRAKVDSFPKAFNKGDHGYDPAFTSMHGIFVASGPSFKAGVVVDPVENIHIYNLLCAALKLQPAPNDGDDRLVRAALK
ncbi:MAG: alkaline phosphatase family protein [Undibacterium sp.]|nr:alkaline phosphatase family protein [Opitutaceae bacterium]